MNRVAEFEKVSFAQFEEDFLDTYFLHNFKIGELEEMYDSIQLPSRATTGSVGYDFVIPCDINLPYGGSVQIPTGIRCKIDDGWGLFLFPRSGLGFKYGISLANTVGVIDSDYYNSYNEGHIMVKLCNDSYSLQGTNGGVELTKGMKFCQGIFLPCGFVRNEEEVSQVRVGGFGSTGV